jgi:hypothetical protein
MVGLWHWACCSVVWWADAQCAELASGAYGRWRLIIMLPIKPQHQNGRCRLFACWRSVLVC